MDDGSAAGSCRSRPGNRSEGRGGEPGASDPGPGDPDRRTGAAGLQATRVDAGDQGPADAGIGALPGTGSDALIEELHRLQEGEGFLSRETLERVALQLQLPFSHVYGVASFYHLFLLQRPTLHRCGVCLGSACFLRGAMGLARQLAARLHVALDDPRGDGVWSLQRLGCLGACGQAPVLVVDGQLLTRLPLEVGGGSLLEGRLRRAGLPAAPEPVP